jgi:alkanesulfonate monooxygenase SsuD/methylene tetrahydromethanopterin reductase-like flavin-dependent oxidoreductase (luciferase family)
MKFGIGLSVQHRPEESQAERFQEHLEQVRLAKNVGFGSIWASQHYLSDPFTYFQPIPTLARVAAEAEGMTLGTGVILLPLHQPVDLAEQLATLDVITGGRLIVGLGLGYRDVENLAMGHDPTARVGRFVEGLQALERLWSGEPASFDGKHFQLRDVRISMPPIQRPRPPIWLAANGDAGVKRAARLGDTWLINPHTTLPMLERQLALFHAERAAASRPRQIPHARVLRHQAGTTPSRRRGPSWSPQSLSALGAGQGCRGRTWSDAFEELARDRFILGDPARVREEIARYRERLGVTSMMFRLQWPGMDQARVLRSIRLLGEQVLPHFA